MKSTHVYSNTTLQVLRFVYACSVLLNAHLQLSWDTPLERKDSVSEGLHLTELKSFCATWKTMILQYYSNVFKNTVWARIGAECDLRSGPVHVESQTAPLCSPLQCVTVSQLEFHKLAWKVPHYKTYKNIFFLNHTYEIHLWSWKKLTMNHRDWIPKPPRASESLHWTVAVVRAQYLPTLTAWRREMKALSVCLRTSVSSMFIWIHFRQLLDCRQNTFFVSYSYKLAQWISRCQPKNNYKQNQHSTLLNFKTLQCTLKGIDPQMTIVMIYSLFHSSTNSGSHTLIIAKILYL